MNVADITALQNIAVNDMRRLTFPYAGDPTDVFTITTSTGAGYIDQSTGKMLSYLDNSNTRKVYEFIYMLHTGKGLWWLGLMLGLAALTIPFMAGSGTLIWWQARRATPKIAHNSPAKTADTVILVGSEGNSTWGFARTLHDQLNKQGFTVHTAPMNQLAATYTNAKRMFILTATYGDGEAPASAKAFIKKLNALKKPPEYPVTVLGFGDRQFPKFCQFADDVIAALTDQGWNEFLPMDRIDRQSTQEFARWGRAVGSALGINLQLVHTVARAATCKMELVERADFGIEVQAPTAIFKFAVPSAQTRGLFGWLRAPRLPSFKAGDLVGILPPDSPIPRFYSLASSSKDGVMEICVRKHPSGMCSEFLHNLTPGDAIDAFIKPNPDFRPANGRAPVILVGAGTGIGPLTGFIRANHKARPMHLYFGGRDPKSDFLYQQEIDGWLKDERLNSARLAFSRVANGGYVQNNILSDAESLRILLAGGAQIMVCGGRDMARGVMDAIDSILAPLELSTAELKAQGRYLEDVY
jgi:sulfite reductase (NADPH) flavoprotein alpha-component